MCYEEVLSKLAVLKSTYEKIDKTVTLEIEEPATEDEVVAVEKELGTPLPIPLREFFLNCSSKITLWADLPEDFELPTNLGDIFRAVIVLSLNDIVFIEDRRKSWEVDLFQI